MLIDTFVDTFANSDDDYEITFLLSFPLQIPILILLLVSGGHIVEMDAVDHVDLSTKSTIVKQARVRAFQEAAMDNESCDKSATDIECRKKSAADTESIEKSTMDTEGIEDTGVQEPFGGGHVRQGKRGGGHGGLYQYQGFPTASSFVMHSASS